MRDKRAHPVHISGILSKAAHRLKFHDKMLEYRLWDQWEKIIGPAIAQHARPERWQRGTLIIRVEHPTWMQELSFLKVQMIEKLRAAFPTTPLKSIRFEVGEFPKNPALPTKNILQRPKRELQESDEAAIANAVDQIRDPDLRESARRAMSEGLKNR